MFVFFCIFRLNITRSATNRRNITNQNEDLVCIASNVCLILAGSLLAVAHYVSHVVPWRRTAVMNCGAQ